MRPPPLLLLSLLLLLGGRGVAAPPADSLSQLPAPQNPKIHLHKTKQVLSWEPVSLDNDTRPVVYRVQYKYSTSNDWFNVDTKEAHVSVNCTNITSTECNFTPNSVSKGFPLHFNISLRVRAELEERVSDWVTVPWFQHFRNVTIGPPENIWVTPGDGSLIIRFYPPFDIEASSKATFLYYVHYWERAGIQQVKGPFRSNVIVLKDLKPLRVYCLQVKAQLSVTEPDISRFGQLSNITCHETIIDASTELQQIILIAVGTFLLLSVLAGGCFFLVLKYRSLIKYWFQSPPSIPLQIEEYLKDPAQPILEALEKDSSPKDDAWDAVSIVSFPGKE
ncbi:interferon gamma receptor 2 [Rhinolophus sinicus]|uniref:interferon gamma receptor 2 n=1 Tax=Rhinolophus sinicus TaxID=89399 RepID=UPI003D79B7EB